MQTDRRARLVYLSFAFVAAASSTTDGGRAASTSPSRPTYLVPERVIAALREVVDLDSERFGYCSRAEGERALDEARTGMSQKDWTNLRTTQRAFAGEFARCSLGAESQSDFNVLAGSATYSLAVAIGADDQLRDRNLAEEARAAALVNTIASWLSANPAVPRAERSSQKNIIRELVVLLQGTYPIPFTVEPDWREVHSGAFQLRMRKATLPGGTLLALFARSRTPLDKYLAAEFAYEIAFRDSKISIAPNTFLTVVVYGPEVNGVSQGYGYVFARGATGEWRPRGTTEYALAAIKRALDRPRTHER